MILTIAESSADKSCVNTKQRSRSDSEPARVLMLYVLSSAYLPSHIHLSGSFFETLYDFHGLLITTSVHSSHVRGDSIHGSCTEQSFQLSSDGLNIPLVYVASSTQPILTLTPSTVRLDSICCQDFGSKDVERYWSGLSSS